MAEDNRLHWVTKADREWIKRTVDEAAEETGYNPDGLTAEEHAWLARITGPGGTRGGMSLEQLACKQRTAIRKAVEDWERDLDRDRARAWWSLLGGAVLGLSAGLTLALLGSLLRWVGVLP